MTLTVIHDRLATTMILFSAIAAVWGLIRYFRGQGIDGSYWGILATGEVLIIAQAGLGFVLWLQGLRPARGIHILYGIVAVLTLPAVYAFSRGRDDRRIMLGYGLILLFLTGIGLRAVGTAG
jgi:hypothetical protein